MNVIRVTVNIDKDELTKEEYDYTIFQLDKVLRDLWGDKAQLLYAPAETINPREELISYSEEVASHLREYLTEFGIDPATVINED